MSYNIRTVFTTIQTLGWILTSERHNTNGRERPGIVYESAYICGDFYIGLTQSSNRVTVCGTYTRTQLDM